MSAPRVKLFENALEAKLFSKLRRAVKQLGSERLRSTYQTTFWFDLKQAQCWPEQAAMRLREHIPSGKKVIGVEWWLSRMKTSNVQVDFHQDRDEKLFLRTKKMITPRWSSVFFLNRARGGTLAITEQLPNPNNPSMCPDVWDFDLVAPKPNRFVVFSGALTHGVLDAHNQVPERRIPIEVPLRLAVIFNWWHRRPEGVLRWSDTRAYRSLACSSGVSFPS